MFVGKGMAESQGIELDLRAQVEVAGGKRNPDRQLRWDHCRHARLEKHIHVDGT